MAKTNVAAFAQSPRTASVSITNAIALTGSNSLETDSCGNTHLLHVAGSDGCIVSNMHALARGTVTGHVVCLFLRKSGDSAPERRLIWSENISAKTVSSTSGPNKQIIGPWTNDNPLRLDAGDELYAGVTVAQSAGINVVCEAVDF